VPLPVCYLLLLFFDPTQTFEFNLQLRAVVCLSLRLCCGELEFQDVDLIEIALHEVTVTIMRLSSPSILVRLAISSLGPKLQVTYGCALCSSDDKLGSTGKVQR
jgi:hypothetical protein